MSNRIEVLKTYKTYVDGTFPRTESGRYYKVHDKNNKVLANACRCSRKDVRNAVVAARGAVKGWSNSSAYNRGQILYRIAEMLEGRRGQFIEELNTLRENTNQAEQEVNEAIDRLIYYAGWTDKYQQVFGSINPVASSHFNFSMPEPTGVVTVFAPAEFPLLGLISVIAPVITGGNTCVVLASQQYPLPAVSFGEVLQSSDVPGGVVNILTGFQEELVHPLTSHMDVNAVFYTDKDIRETFGKQIDENGALNVKRIVHKPIDNWLKNDTYSPYLITNLQEVKTTWHPVGY